MLKPDPVVNMWVKFNTSAAVWLFFDSAGVSVRGLTTGSKGGFVFPQSNNWPVGVSVKGCLALAQEALREAGVGWEESMRGARTLYLLPVNESCLSLTSESIMWLFFPPQLVNAQQVMEPFSSGERLMLTSGWGKTLLHWDKSALKNSHWPLFKSWSGMPPRLFSLGAWLVCDWRAPFRLRQPSPASR